jgi:threonine/homoserine/homoserine lactone efflux protein
MATKQSVTNSYVVPDRFALRQTMEGLAMTSGGPMPDSSHLSLFLIAAVILAVTPGPAVLYIVTRSVSQGRAAGVVSALGVAAGGLVHVLGAALGLSALLATSALAFATVKYAGAAYLVWLGIRKLRQAPDARTAEPPADRSLSRTFGEGAIVNILNPKTALFFLAFLPQFVAPSRGSVPMQLAGLGTLFLVIALVTDTAWALLASGAGRWLKGHPRFVASERYVAGSVYVGLGLAAAVSGHGRK